MKTRLVDHSIADDAFRIDAELASGDQISISCDHGVVIMERRNNGSPEEVIWQSTTEDAAELCMCLSLLVPQETEKLLIPAALNRPVAKYFTASTLLCSDITQLQGLLAFAPQLLCDTTINADWEQVLAEAEALAVLSSLVN